MRATLTRDAFDDPDWLFETKWDGFRVEAVVSDGAVELWTRGHQDASRYFGRFLEPPTWIDAKSAVVDGEVVAFDAQGEPDFGLLQQQIGRRAARRAADIVVYQAFDLLELDGASLLDRPLDERKALLKKALRKHPRVRYSDHVVGSGIAAFEAARERGVEGDRRQGPPLAVPARTAVRPLAQGQDPARAGAGGRWLDARDRLRGRFRRPAGRRPRGRRAAVRGQGRRRLHDRDPGGAAAALAPLAADGSPFGGPPVRVPAVNWVEPRLVDPRRVRRVDRRRQGPPGGLQGHRPRQGSQGRDPRATDRHSRLTSEVG